MLPSNNSASSEVVYAAKVMVMRRDAESGRAEGHVSQLDEIGNCNETQIQVRKVTTHGERREG